MQYFSYAKTAMHLKKIQQLEQQLNELRKAKENDEERVREQKEQASLKIEEEKRRAQFAASEIEKLREVCPTHCSEGKRSLLP